MKVMSIFGTRPEIIRLSRIFSKLDFGFEHIMVNTNQNFTPELNKVFFSDLKSQIIILKSILEDMEKKLQKL